MSSFNHSYLSYEHGAFAFRRRNPRFSWEELQILAQETSKNFELLRQKETDDGVKAMKQRVWTLITEKVNAVNRSNSRREPLQLKRKWIEARSRVRHKLMASHRRRSGSHSHESPSSNGSGEPQRPAAAATPVELSYFEKLLTLSMSDELQQEEARPDNGGVSHIPVATRTRAAKAEAEEVAVPVAEENEADMWTNHDDDELELMALPPNGHDDAETSGAPTPVADSQARGPCLVCGSGSASMERMYAERHAYKLNILHNKSHYWYAKCRQVAPEAALPPPAAPGRRLAKEELLDLGVH